MALLRDQQFDSYGMPVGRGRAGNQAANQGAPKSTGTPNTQATVAATGTRPIEPAGAPNGANTLAAGRPSDSLWDPRHGYGQDILWGETQQIDRSMLPDAFRERQLDGTAPTARAQLNWADGAYYYIGEDGNAYRQAIGSGPGFTGGTWNQPGSQPPELPPVPPPATTPPPTPPPPAGPPPGTDPDTDPAGDGGSDAADRIRGRTRYTPGDYTDGAQDPTPGAAPEFAGYTGTDIPQTLNAPGVPLGPSSFDTTPVAGDDMTVRDNSQTFTGDISTTGLRGGADAIDFDGDGRATEREVDILDTVAGQLQGLLSSDNPLVQQARLRAEREAASRGLNNSSMALQSGEQAAFASMLPVAQQDAETYFNQGRANQDWINEFGAQEFKGEIDSGLLKQQGDTDANLQGNDALLEGRRANQDAGIESDLLNQEAQSKLDQTKVESEIEQALLDQQGNIDAGLEFDQFQQERVLKDDQFRQDSNLSYQDYAEESMLNAENYANEFELNEQQNGAEYALQQLKNQVLIDTAAIEAENKLLIQSNAGAAQVYAEYLDSIESLYSNMSQEGASTAQLTAALADLQRGLKENLDMMAAFVDIDLSEEGETYDGEPADGTEPTLDPENPPPGVDPGQWAIFVEQLNSGNFQF